jgi:hypothetical protein
VRLGNFVYWRLIHSTDSYSARTGAADTVATFLTLPPP